MKSKLSWNYSWVSKIIAVHWNIEWYLAKDIKCRPADKVEYTERGHTYLVPIFKKNMPLQTREKISQQSDEGLIAYLYLKISQVDYICKY